MKNLNKREQNIANILGAKRLCADEENDEGVTVTVFDFEDKKAARDHKADEQLQAQKEKAPQAKNDEKAAKGKGTMIIVLMIVVGLVVGFLAGYFITGGIFSLINSREKDFYAGNMTITLTESFAQYNLPYYSAVFASDDIEVFVSKTSSTAADAKEYAQSIVDFNLFNCQVESKGGLNYFVHESTESDGKLYQNYYFTYKDSSDFWLIQFTVLDKQAKKYESSIMKWAGSVEFN